MMPFIVPVDFTIISQHACGPTEEIRRAVSEQFGEKDDELIYSDERVAMTLHRSKQTWTISMQFANGMMCLIAAGSDWPIAKKS